MEQEIIVNDINLAILLRNTLVKNGNRNPKYNSIGDFKRFTLEELSTITSLNLEEAAIEDVSVLKYCTKLKELSIISANAKNVRTELSNDAKYNYSMKKNKITDFSVISELTSLESLTISYDDNLTNLDISNLKQLISLNLDHNRNLTEVKGINGLSNLAELVLYGNSMIHSIDIPDMMKNAMLCNVKLDVDLYPILKQQYQNLDEILYEQQKVGITCKWEENLSNIRTNEFTTSKISEMDKKAQEILSSIIKPTYNDVEKVSAIYAYIIQNIQYDHESLAAAKGEKNAAYEEAMNDMGDRFNTILDRRQSSYNAILKGKSVCEGYTNMMHYLLNSVGLQSKTCSCSADLKDTVVGANSNHSVIKVKIDDNWYYFDPTWDAQRRTLKNFFKTKDEFSKSHRLSMTEDSVVSPEIKAYTNAELTEILNRVIEDRENKREGKETQPQNYEREISSRSKYSVSPYLETHKKQDVNLSHEYNVYHNVIDFDNKTFQYGLEAPTNTQQEYLDYIGNKLGDEYSRGALEEKSELARQFAMLEVQGRFGDFENPYDKGYETSGYDNPKLLLQLEKVDGLNIEEFEDIIGLDTSTLHKDIFVATYEIEEWDNVLKKNVMKPVKEYYQIDENGDFDIIGTGTEYETTFVIDGVQLDVKTEQVLQGDFLEQVTQRELGDRLIKNGIEDSFQFGKVTEVAEITDIDFLRDFSKQCGIPETWDLIGRTFIVSSVNEKGEESFDVIIRNDPETKYEHLSGIEHTGKEGRKMYTTTGKMIPGGAKELDKTKTLSEFVTKSGHRYSITRNAEGKLGFNEIFRENENMVQGQHVDTYTYSTGDLMRVYENMELSQEDLNDAFETLNRTKSEREQIHNQTINNNFEGR